VPPALPAVLAHLHHQLEGAVAIVSGRPIDMSARVFRNARILIVDDEPMNVDLLRRLLERAGFSRLESTNDSREAVDLYVKFRPDLILLDLHMPHRDGLEVMDELNQIAEASYLPILMLTGDDTPEAKREALSRGAKDFLNKPFHSDEVLLRIGTLLETRFLYLQIQSQNQILEAKVRDRTRELEAAQIEIIERLARAAEFRDDNTGQHTARVGQMAALLARQIGLPDSQVSLIRRAAPLHDVGKIGIPDRVLLKPGRLDDEEMRVMRTHPRRGHDILASIGGERIAKVATIVLHHHEAVDGSGYPEGIREESIPLMSRIVSIADAYDAMATVRPYHKPRTHDEVMTVLQAGEHRKYDGSVLATFARVIEHSSYRASNG